MHEVIVYLNEIIDFILAGMAAGFAHINAALGLIIALVAAWRLSNLKRLWAVALAATIVHLLAEIVIPVLDNRASFRLPPDLLTLHYWQMALGLYLGYVLVIAIFYVIKKTVMPKVASAH